MSRTSRAIAFEDRDIADSEIASTEECEVLIIGAGIGGLMGSLKAAEEGAQTITLEKMTEGRSAWESFGAVGARFQKEQGIEIDPAQLRDEIYRAADWRVDPCAIETYVSRSGEVADFWQDMLDKGGSGWELYKFDQAPNYNGFPVIDSYVNFRMPEGISTAWLFGLYVCKELRKVAETYDNLSIRYETPAVQLVREEGGRVHRVHRQGGRRVRAHQRVEGRFAGDWRLRCEPRDDAGMGASRGLRVVHLVEPQLGNNRDGHMMGLKVGADMDSLPHPVMNFSNATPSTFVEKRVYFPGAMNYSIVVTEEGTRFANENQARQYLSNAINVQKRRGHTCFHIFDAMIQSALDSEPSGEKQLERDEEKGHLFRASSLSELAEKAGIDAAALEETWRATTAFSRRAWSATPITIAIPVTTFRSQAARTTRSSPTA